MNKISNPPLNTKTDEFNMEHFRIRLTARLCTIVACLVLYIPRIPSILADPSFSSGAQLFFTLSLPFPLLMALVITLEYFLYKKLGPGIVKYSSFVDLMLLIFFIGDWVMILIGSANKVQNTHPISFKIGAMYGFTSFSWRTLMVTLIVQKWQLKILAPATGVIIVTSYAIYYNPGAALFTMLNAGTQLFNIIIIIYCEDKFKWKMIWANIQKEKWMQVNNFILDSLPENIMILDLVGEAKFVSEHCKAFIQKFHLPIETKELFKKIRGLKQQPYESSDPLNSLPSPMKIEKENKFFADSDGASSSVNTSRKQTLEDLVVNFQIMIQNKQIQERQFLIYNGKLKIEDKQNISLEVKISFVQHFENHYIILIIRDTTKRDLLLTLEEANKYKDQLLASVSHELRAPLNGNINLVESAVNSPKIPESIKESCLIPALRSSKFLLHIINDILDMSQIKEKKLRLVFDLDDLKETLKSSAQLVELQAKKKGLELQLELDPDLSTTFCTDHIRLSQIVLNLLNNAIKFTKEGLVKLTAKPLSDPNLVEIRVEDSGIGISQENVKSLFSSFTHIEFEGRQTMNPAGVGLGLNIARNLAALLAPKGHQGIIVNSIPGRGSTFKFILENRKRSHIELGYVKIAERSNESCEVADESPRLTNSIFFSKLQRSKNGSTSLMAERSESSVLLNPQCFCPKVLIVDDNPFNTMAFETILGSLEINCDSVYSGLACIKSLLNRQSKPCGDHCKQYSVIFMDQEMPEMSGSETTYEIKRLQEESLLPQGIRVIGCTAHKSKEEVDKFMKSGLEKCIHKPISAALIKDILNGGTRLRN